jgi:hypothetical protein
MNIRAAGRADNDGYFYARIPGIPSWRVRVNITLREGE